jgi:hypothetical protein
MARFASGTTDQYIYFDAVDVTDGVTRETGLSSFTVYRSRNGSAATLYTSPTILEMSSANMPGVYILLLDEDMTIGSGNETEEVCLYITHASMRPVSLKYELYEPVVPKIQSIDNQVVVIDALIDFIYTFTDDLPTALPTIEGKIDTLDTNLDGLITTVGVNGAGLEDIPLNPTAPTADSIADEIESRTLDANIVSVNNVPVNGAGSEDDPWGPV